jgi:hypothetical protein
MCINKGRWEALISKFCLEIEREEISDIHYLGKRMNVNNNFNLLVSYYKLKRAAASVLKKVPPR